MGPNLIKAGGIVITKDYNRWKFVDNVYFVLRGPSQLLEQKTGEC
jgi:hypothetical protein